MSLYSVPIVLLIIFTYCSQSMWTSTLSLLFYSLYLYIVVSPCEPLLCPYCFTNYIYILYAVHVSLYSVPIVLLIYICILYTVHVSLYSVPIVLLIIFTYCSQSMWASTLSLLIYSLYLHIVVNACEPLLCPYWFTHYIYIL